MLPSIANDGLAADFEEVVEPSKNYKLITEKNRCVGFVDELEAIKQAIFLYLSVERYEHAIYSFNVGIEAKDLIGQPYEYVASEIKRRISECLLQDDRITAVDDFIITKNKKKVHVSFTAYTIYGQVEAEKEVDY